MIVPETYHVPHCATHAQTFFASEQPGVVNTSRRRTTILPSQLAAIDSCFGLAGPYQHGVANIDREKWLCACVTCWPHRVGVSVCHHAFLLLFT